MIGFPIRRWGNKKKRRSNTKRDPENAATAAESKKGVGLKKKKENKEEETGFVLHGPMSARGCCVDGEKKKKKHAHKKKEKETVARDASVAAVVLFQLGRRQPLFRVWLRIVFAFLLLSSLFLVSFSF